MLRLSRTSGYWRASRKQLGAVATLHEDEECLTQRAHAKGTAFVTLATAKSYAEAGLARLCKRCGGMK